MKPAKATGLTKVQKAARDALAELLAIPEEADRVYNALPDSHDGRIVSTDVARFLDKSYKETPMGKARDLVPGWDLAWRYAQDRLKREIVHRNGRRIVSFMAGGWGAGKTHALENSPSPDLAWDGTLKETTTELAPKGALHYSKRHEHYYAEAAREIEALNPA